MTTLAMWTMHLRVYNCPMLKFLLHQCQSIKIFSKFFVWDPVCIGILLTFETLNPETTIFLLWFGSFKRRNLRDYFLVPISKSVFDIFCYSQHDILRCCMDRSKVCPLFQSEKFLRYFCKYIQKTWDMHHQCHQQKFREKLRLNLHFSYMIRIAKKPYTQLKWNKKRWTAIQGHLWIWWLFPFWRGLHVRSGYS